MLKRDLVDLLDSKYLKTNQKDYLAHVIYHQESGTAAVAAVNGRGSRFGGTLSKRQSSFSLSLEQDLRTWSLLTKFENLEEGRDSLRLDVFQAVPVGSTVLHWDRRDWLAYHDRPRPTHEIFAVPHPALSRPSLTRTPLPENPTAEQVDRYLDGIPFFLSDYTPHQAQQKIEEDLKAISPQHLDRLLARMPAGLYAEKIIHQVLQTQLSEEHQSAYLQALARDPGLAILAEPLGWQSEAASVLARRLQSHRPLDYSSNGIAIQIVASQADPATFADLRWHFIHAQDNLKSMASSLQKCSGFPFEEALAEALRNKTIAGAGLDVLSVEPPPADHPLLAADLREQNLIITPHSAWLSLESRQRLLEGLLINLQNWIEGKPTNRVA